MFAIAAVIVFALALILDLADAGVDFPFTLLGLLLLACHFAFGGWLAVRVNRAP
jgi:fucose 4-O-acetylase-like acetyltransferase